MKTILIILLACTPTRSGYLREELNIHKGFADQTTQQKTDLVEIDKAAAAQIAKEHAEQTYGSLQAYSIVLCEQDVFWRVLFEPKDVAVNHFGMQYVLSRRSGQILKQRKLPLAAPSNKNLSPTAVTRAEAIAIAKKNGKKAYWIIGWISRDGMRVR